MLANNPKAEVSVLLSEASQNPRWEHERTVLAKELPGKDVSELLWMLIESQEQVARDVQSSKEKDDHRGVRIIPDYASAHPEAIEDGFVKETWRITQELKLGVKKLLLQVMA